MPFREIPTRDRGVEKSWIDRGFELLLLLANLGKLRHRNDDFWGEE